MKAFEICKKSVAWLFALFMAFVLVDLLVCQSFIDQRCKKVFSLPNPALLLLGLLAVAGITLLALRVYGKIRPLAERAITRKHIAALAVLGFFVQVYIAYNIFFLTDWDAGIILDSAIRVAEGESGDAYYYTVYPNNLFLTFFYALVLKVVGLFGIAPNAFVLVVLQCLFSALTSYLLFSVTYEMTGSKPVAAFAFVLYACLIGLSPWFVIPYSDGAGILFPILAFRIFQLAKRAPSRKKRLLLWGLLGAAAFVGFKIKPQNLIILIAILLLTVAKDLFSCSKDKKALIRRLGRIALCLAVFVALSLSFSAVAARQDLIPTDTERELGITHFFMMGLNDETDGIYSAEDVVFSSSIPEKDARGAANLEEAWRRLSALGIGGLIRHVAEKTLVNFGDGTFAWGVEGTFYKQVYEEPNSTVAPFLRSFYYSGGEHYDLFHTSMQTVWLTVLALGAASTLALLRRRERTGATDDLPVLLLALLGLFAFETLFEARARYLFSYAPIFIVCACVGLYTLFHMIQNATKKGQ